MNSNNLLRIGIPVLGLCVISVFQSGCRSKVLDDRANVPPAEVETMPAEKDTFAANDDFETKPTAAKTGRKTASPAKSAPIDYPMFEDTDNTPIYSAPSKTSAKGATYTVVSGDSLGKIAKRYGVKTSALAKANNIQINAILPIGKKLIIPGKSNIKQPDTKPQSTKAAADTKNKQPGPGLYIVRSGDSLSRIAKRYGVKTIDLAQANNLQLTAILRIGQTLKIPGAKTDTQVPAQSNKEQQSVAETTTQTPQNNTTTASDQDDKILDELENKKQNQTQTTAPQPKNTPDLSKSAPTRVKNDISVADFCKNHNISVADFLRYNSGYNENSIIPKNRFIVLP